MTTENTKTVETLSKKEIKHPVIVTIIAAVAVIWILSALASTEGSHKAPVAAQQTTVSEENFRQLHALMQAEDVSGMTDLFNKYKNVGDPRWNSHEDGINTVIDRKTKYFNDGKAELIQALKRYLSLGYQGGYMATKLWNEYFFTQDTDWLAFLPQVETALAKDRKIDADKATEKAMIKILKDNFEEQFSAWDGSHLASEELIKSVLNDPSSYKHVETRFKGELAKRKIDVYTKYRAKNAYNATVTEIIVTRVKIADDGTVDSVRIIDHIN